MRVQSSSSGEFCGRRASISVDYCHLLDCPLPCHVSEGARWNFSLNSEKHYHDSEVQDLHTSYDDVLVGCLLSSEVKLKGGFWDF